MRHVHPQVRFAWGLPDGAAPPPDVEVAVVVDVLSFTTTLSVAVDRGIEVVPCRWVDADAARLADRHGAVRAAGRRRTRHGQITLSPQSIRTADPVPARVVLPSPNGSAIAAELAEAGSTCLGASFRDASAVAEWLVRHESTTVTVMAAGDRHRDGRVSPAEEDLWGAGAVICGLHQRGWTDLSAEAEAARDAYAAIRGRERDALVSTVGGQELLAHGYPVDVDIAAEVDEGHVVAVLVGGVFVPSAP
jgi:2-phosphosulfolactate phosphatase